MSQSGPKASVCFHRCESDGLCYMAITVEGRGEPFVVAMQPEEFEEFLDAGCIVFLEINPHVHTQIALQPLALPLSSVRPNLN